MDDAAFNSKIGDLFFLARDPETTRAFNEYAERMLNEAQELTEEQAETLHILLAAQFMFGLRLLRKIVGPAAADQGEGPTQ